VERDGGTWGVPVWGLPPAGPAGRLPERADVLVVGGGITGVSLCRWLGPRAVLVEADRLGAGASGRNAGFLSAGVGHCYANAVRRYGRQRAAALQDFTATTHRLLAEALAGRARAYRQRGSRLVPADPEEARDLEESAQLLAEDGFEARWDGRQLVRPGDGELDPLEAVQVLASDLPPGTIQTGVRVERVEAGAEGVRVLGNGHECLAGAVVLATNAYTSQLVPGIGISPVRAQMAAAPAPDGLVPMPTGSDRGFRYWRQRADGMVLAGGYRNLALQEEVGYEAVPTTRVQAHLDRHLGDLGVTQPATYRWAGIMGFTADELPLVGPVSDAPGIWVCGGYTGHGMAFAFHCARLVAEALVGSRAVATSLLP
jgi:gamma-glutamylputrescine oxidase